MPCDRLSVALQKEIEALREAGTAKGPEAVISGVLAACNGRGPRYRLEGEGERGFIRMNANDYLGMSRHPEVVAAEEAAVRACGAGPGAVRFISGTWAQHTALERTLATFHGRDSAMIFSSAYAAVMGLLPPLIDEHTAVISDELNHNSIINAIRLARPRERHVYRHLDMDELEGCLDTAAAGCRRAIVVTDGVFSMRGDHAPLGEITALARRFDGRFGENVLVVVDDSHGVGAFGATGRGTEEQAGSEPVDLLVATLGKALGVNGGYVAGGETLLDYLREKSPFYVYSNPVTPGEAAAATAALRVLDSDAGRARVAHLRAMSSRFAAGLEALGLETLPGDHPIVPLMIRDTARTAALVAHLRRHGVLATAITFPVVPRGEEEIRFQLCADHTEADVDEVLDVLAHALA